MRFKLDENFGSRTANVFREYQHEVDTIRDEGLQGAPDSKVFEAIIAEDRCLITLDLDFADVIRFPVKASPGVIVIRVPRNPSLQTLEELVRLLLRVVETQSPRHQLWIVEPGRIRVHSPSRQEPPS